MLVFRVEDRNTGDGPFGSPLHVIYNKARLASEADLWSHPGPDTESESFRTKWDRLWPKWGYKSLRFGFESPGSYWQWFDSKLGRQKMAKMNGVVRIYRVHSNSVIRGDRQVAFHIGRATLVRELPADFELIDVKDLLK